MDLRTCRRSLRRPYRRPGLGWALWSLRGAGKQALPLRTRERETKSIRVFTNRTNGLALSPQGNIYGCQEGSRRIIEMQRDGSAIPLEARLGGARINYPSDLTVDSHGRIWFADPYNERPSHGPQVFPDLPHASVLRLEQHPTSHAWQVRRMTSDTRAPRSWRYRPTIARFMSAKAI